MSVTTFELKRILEGNPEVCPVCRLVLDSVKRYVDHLFYQDVNDIAVREAIRHAHGFCRYHSGLIAKQRDALGSAIILRDVLMTDLQEIDGKTYFQPGNRRPLGRLLETSTRKLENQVCPICQVESERDQIAVDSLLEGLDHPEFVDLCRRAGGICLPHFRLAFNRSQGGERWKTLLEIERQGLHTLTDQLDKLAVSYDYREEEKPMAEEAGSWRRALNATSSWVEE